MAVNTVIEFEHNVSLAGQYIGQNAKLGRTLLIKQYLLSSVLMFFLIGVAPSYAADNGETWVVLGDSISAGYGISDGSGWVVLFQDKLDSFGHAVNVVNESISGDTTAGGLARLPEMLARLEPDVVILELGGNDGLRGLSLRAMENNLSKMIDLCQSQGIGVLLLGMKIPPNYGRKYGSLFESVFSSVAKKHQVRLLPFFLEGVGGDNKLMQTDRVHPNADAQKRLVDNVWEFVVPVLDSRSGGKEY